MVAVQPRLPNHNTGTGIGSGWLLVLALACLATTTTTTVATSVAGSSAVDVDARQLQPSVGWSFDRSNYLRQNWHRQGQRTARNPIFGTFGNPSHGIPWLQTQNEVTNALYVPASAFVEMSEATEAAPADGLGHCKTCVYVMERIKHGFEFVLPSICIEVYKGGISAAGGGGAKGGAGGKTGSTGPSNDFGDCHQVLASLSVWGNNVRSWFNEGCYKVEEYGAMELIKPCPSHVVCSQLTEIDMKPFCQAPVPDPLMDGK